MTFIEKIRNNARAILKTIVLPEGEELRIIKAAEYLNSEKLVIPVLIGNEQQIRKIASENNCNIDGIEIKDPLQDSNIETYAKEFYALRKKKGVTYEIALETVKYLDPMCSNHLARARSK
ncbi:MAG: phosphate acyltransferase, partial [Calditrichaceae bacterium]